VTDVEVIHRRGWEVLVLRSTMLIAEVLPGKGGDVLSLRLQPDDRELLFQTPWGLRQHGAVATAGTSDANLIEQYPGGWQTVFPNGGDACVEQGVEWGMHGEAWLAPWDWHVIATGVELRTRLVRSPFELVKRVELFDEEMQITETVRHVGGHPVEVMWSHHPVLGGAFLDGCRIEAPPCTVVVDDTRTMPNGDLQVGARGRWPFVAGRDGSEVDLRVVPPADSPCDRFAYLTDLDEPLVSVVNDAWQLAVDVRWDADVFPAAWLWLENNATAGFPWFQAVRSLGIEPASSWPGQGIAAVRAKTGNQLSFAPGQERTAQVGLRVRAL
jgi:hypothetical protein